MKRALVFLEGVCLLAATTIGAGMFALPYVAAQGGWLTGLVYLAILSGIVIFAHTLYARVLRTERERERLLGLVRRYLGQSASRIACVAVVGGLLLTLVVYLVLAARFVSILVPGMGLSIALTLFWAVSSLPLAARLPRIMGAEFAATILMLAIVLFIFAAGVATSGGSSGPLQIPAVNIKNSFLPFGAVLFALAGWTAVEPLRDWSRKRRAGANFAAILACGTVLSAVVYLLFAAGVISLGGNVSPDTISGLTAWPLGKVRLLAILGLFAVWTSYVPIALEVKNALTRDLARPRAASYAVVIFTPILLVALGLRSFLSAVGLAGGIFLSVQYLLILLVSRRALALSVPERLFIHITSFVFLLGALYEVYYFVIP